MGRSLPEWHEVFEEAAEVEPDEWAACWEEPLAQPFCLHSVLGLSPSSEGDVASRVRAAFRITVRARRAHHPSTCLPLAVLFPCLTRPRPVQDPSYTRPNPVLDQSKRRQRSIKEKYNYPQQKLQRQG